METEDKLYKKKLINLTKNWKFVERTLKRGRTYEARKSSIKQPTRLVIVKRQLLDSPIIIKGDMSSRKSWRIRKDTRSI